MTNLRIFLLLFFLILLNGMKLYSQNEHKGSMKVKIKTIDAKGKTMDHSVVTVYENGNVIKTVEGNPTVVYLDLNKNYVIGISENEKYMFIAIDSSVPAELQDKILPYTCKVMLGEKFSSIEKPFVKVCYKEKEFDFMAPEK